MGKVVGCLACAALSSCILFGGGPEKAATPPEPSPAPVVEGGADSALWKLAAALAGLLATAGTGAVWKAKRGS